MNSVGIDNGLEHDSFLKAIVGLKDHGNIDINFVGINRFNFLDINLILMITMWILMKYI